MERLRKLFENKGTFIPDSPEEEEPKFYTEKEPMDIDVSGGFSDEDEETNEITINGKKYRPIKESKKHRLKEQYDRFFTNRIVI